MMTVWAKRGSEALVVRTIVAAGVDVDTVSEESRALAIAVGMSYASQGYDRVGVVIASSLANAKAVVTGGDVTRGQLVFGCDQAAG